MNFILIFATVKNTKLKLKQVQDYEKEIYLYRMRLYL